MTKDEHKAVEWYEKAAAQGLDFAHLSLGRMYATGQGVSKDDVHAYARFSVAAELGSESAKTELSQMEAVLTPPSKGKAKKLADQLMELLKNCKSNE